MEIIYISSLVSKPKMNKIIEESNNKPLQSIQKFHRLICEGFAKNGINVKTISSIPMSRKISKKIFWFDKKEIINGIEYTYVPFVNFKIIRQIWTFFGIIIKVLKESLKKEKKVFICDILNTTISYTTLVLCKILKLKCIAIVTDLPKDLCSTKKLNRKIHDFLQDKYDSYIILTEAMNNVVNLKLKPYMVMEGIADINECTINKEIKYKSKVCIYAGGLYEKYGVKSLIKAFSNIKDNNVELHLYGNGELENFIKNNNDKRIKYFGVVENDIIIREEKKAILLINPRFTHEEYTKFSFPSKNIEYMASGTPLLTTKLPGMPKEYYEYIYLFEDESVEGMTKTLEKILKKDKCELKEKGENARKFILENKNNVVQCKKIIDLINKKGD